MRKIYKTISLEPMTSRLPSVVPAYIPGTTTPITFDDDQLKARGYAYPSNYGLIPCNVEIHGSVCNTHDSCGVISFERLSVWYHKFKEYYKLLNDYGHCSTVYSSATQYYDNESKRWPDDLRLGNDRQTYVDLDAEIACMGGVVSSNTRSQTACQTSGIIESVDNGFYKWICDNVIPTYKLPRSLQDYWQRDTLYYPDVIKWIGWFNDRSQFASYTTEASCSASSDCCECVEYVKRGGAAELARMKKWYSGDTRTEGIKQKIEKLNSTIIDSDTKKPKPCFLPRIISPIELQNSIEDLGEFTIFCEEYKEGVDYRNGDGYGATANTKGGTVVLKDNEILRLKDEKSGYEFNTTFMENKFDRDSWDSLISGDTSYLYDIEEDEPITGYTSSKLQYIHLDNYLTDDVGNMVEGLYDVGTKKNHQPKEGEVLEPLYQKGVITNIVNVDGHEGMFKGDIIDSMKFYYKFVDGGKDSETERTVSEKLKVVETINSSTSVKNTKEATFTTEDDGEQTRIITSIYDDDIYCDVTYHVGNIYTLVNNQAQLSVEGVKYVETVQFQKTRVEYQLKTENMSASPSDVSKPSVHSVSYPIYVYKLKQKENIIESNTYNTPYGDNLSKISYKLKTDGGEYIRKSAYKFVCRKCGFKSKEDVYLDHCPNCGETEKWVGGDIIQPIIMEEYRFGIAAPESVKSNIYIDRGINSAFEKHLKLGEVTSLESMLQYGNGYFKIMEN